MAKVYIDEPLFKEIRTVFRGEANEVIDLLESLEQNPKKGKDICTVATIAVKEIKYRGYRFYFLADAHKIRMLKVEELMDILIRFVRMSDKKDQQKVINEIIYTLKYLGVERF